jgi:hypothetical protein
MVVRLCVVVVVVVVCGGDGGVADGGSGSDDVASVFLLGSRPRPRHVPSLFADFGDVRGY